MNITCVAADQDLSMRVVRTAEFGGLFGAPRTQAQRIVWAHAALPDYVLRVPFHASSGALFLRMHGDLGVGFALEPKVSAQLRLLLVCGYGLVDRSYDWEQADDFGDLQHALDAIAGGD